MRGGWEEGGREGGIKGGREGGREGERSACRIKTTLWWLGRAGGLSPPPSPGYYHRYVSCSRYFQCKEMRDNAVE